MTVNILGTEYTVSVKKYDEDKAFERLRGYHDSFAKELVVCDPSTFSGWENEPQASVDAALKETLRH